ncbi:MAG: type II toxin-antitoxin system Phd/YefM family antitoxin [Deltaproteobacteria bacterium]|jgi:antitoxin (DNA-binding transcriptional repressor) of toxin-antitoxin stability system|nr:type II toxin-antitoxin system Phd/YefM family antitoxin [Deltaproteobacteria bacterium]MBW2530848.1 type II toxin-antitoxin system Phd/YefM family antitoxin [Deltaproteobacteria bacterium]
MRLVNIHEAKTHLSKLIQAVIDGEDIVIARGNVPLVRLELLPSAKRTRQVGFAKDHISMAEDFDAPLDDFGEPG